ncbi:reverse transcriptase domain-containing protein [Citrus sinensis]|uniref:Reverse transcriptase domain-containing protein n=1 Tax=Citrus sinensis TaxID=2711 RepID=A0ACB8L5K4_CITSI|nr:reverse transcriptase domain-containing protein [Citrus sinensis]
MRKKKNNIEKLRNNQGMWCLKPCELDELITEYFQNLFSSSGCICEPVLSCIEPSISALHNQLLLEPFTTIDVKDALFSMHPDKSPGPDGMNPAFYQKYWHIVEHDVMDACLNYITNRALPTGLNDTLIVLIPKKTQPESLTDMQPIALCNVLYKIIAKMLANRMKLVLDSVISESQSAFVPGRVITDNILISTEIVHYLKRKKQGKTGITALKIDMSKACNRIEWLFLKSMMLRMGFDEGWVALIMMCVSTVSYKVNYNKSVVSFSANMDEVSIRQVCGILEVLATSNHGTYLGLPSLIRRKKSAVFAFIKEKVWQRLQGWNQKFLSKAGKEIMLKTVAQAIPNYAMNIYLLPLDLCKELELMMNAFWWGTTRNGGRGIHWLRWDLMCKPKSMGGVGFKRLHDFNIAILGKQCWKLITNLNSLVARILKARYYPRSSFADATIGFNPSYTWRSIMAAKHVVVKGSHIKIGSGQQVQINKDPWRHDADNGFITTELAKNIATATVNCLMALGQRRCDNDLVVDVFNTRDAAMILQVPLNTRQDNDRWFWLADPNGEFTVRSCYNLLNSVSDVPNSKVWKFLWGLEAPGKVKQFLWRSLKNILPTADNLLSRKVDVSPICPICSVVNDVGGRCSSFVEWMEQIFTRCRKEDCKLVVMLAGAKRKNFIIVEQEQEQLGHGSVCWGKPPQGWLKCNVDAGVFSSQSRYSFGGVIRDSGGAFIAAKCQRFPGLFHLREAEALDVCEALSWIKNLQLSKIIVEIDCLNVYSALITPNTSPNDFGLIIADCQTVAQLIGEVRFFFVRRSANFAAHNVVRVGVLCQILESGGLFHLHGYVRC